MNRFPGTRYLRFKLRNSFTTKLPIRLPVSQKSECTSIDEIGEQDAIARFHVRADPSDGMPGIVPDCERIAAVGRERNLCSIRPLPPDGSRS